MPTQENLRIVGLVVLVIWLITSSGAGPSYFIASKLARQRLARHRQAWEALNGTRWGDFAPVYNDTDKDEGSHHDVDSLRPGWLNITGFRREDGFAWEDLGRFREGCAALRNHALSTTIVGSDPENPGKQLPAADLPIWQDISGVVRGRWTRHPTSVTRTWQDYNLTSLAPEGQWGNSQGAWAKNVTANQGRIAMRIAEKFDIFNYTASADTGSAVASTEGLRDVTALLSLEDDDDGSFDLRLFGAHWVNDGSVLLTTTTDKFEGIFGLPHLTTNEERFEAIKVFSNTTTDEKLRNKESSKGFTDSKDPWAATQDGSTWSPSPHCEYVVYLQTYPARIQARGIAREDLAMIEQELLHPLGRPEPDVPELEFSAVIWSPDCAFLLETDGPPRMPSTEANHLVGWTAEVDKWQGSFWTFIVTAVFAGQALLTKAQWKASATPSAVARISFYSMAIMLMADNFILVMGLVVSLDSSDLKLTSLLFTVVALANWTVGGAFLNQVHALQESEWTTMTPAPPAAAADVPVIVSSDQDIDAEIAENVAAGGAAVPTAPLLPFANPRQPRPLQPQVLSFSSIMSRMLAVVSALGFVSVYIGVWHPRIRPQWLNWLVFIYLSMWVPQIVRNIQRNCRRATSWQFTIGQSVLRILPVGYFYLDKDNIMFAQTDWMAFAVLAGWLWLQLWVLAFQNVLGPRYGIPQGWLPDAWEYHPILSEDDRETGTLPIGLLSTSTPGSPVSSIRKSLSSDKNGLATTRSITCVICTEALEVGVYQSGIDSKAAASASGVVGLLERRRYMVTPCRHIFHSQCLEGWMRFRLVCPICRESLPPL